MNENKINTLNVECFFSSFAVVHHRKFGVKQQLDLILDKVSTPINK